MMRRPVFSFLALLVLATSGPAAQKAPIPTAQLRNAQPLVLPGRVDSSSPAVWDRLDGRRDLFVLTSFAGQPSRATGASLETLDRPVPVLIEPWPGGGVWIEAVVKDEESWYGFYHNENRASVCGNRTLNYPRIGTARSDDFGATWTDLGIILDLPPETFACGTRNTYFAGGVGDMSVLLDRAHRDLYIYFSQYGRAAAQQGVAVARLAWADRDAPAGKLTVWSGGAWLAPTRIDDDVTGERWVYPAATPLVAPSRPWHDNDRVVDAFWGPSIHWNSYLRQYVMLLNRASDETFAQEGIYVSFSPRLGDPLAWSAPQRILRGGRWYPQVVGLEAGRGSDAWAGQVARFFLSGRSDHLIEFTQ
jgi:hypothetical protein